MPNLKKLKPKRATIHVFEVAREMRVRLEIDPPYTLKPGEEPPRYIKLGQRLMSIALGDPSALKNMTALLKNYLPGMRPEHRLALFDEITKGFCPKCGGNAPCECSGKIIVPGAFGSLPPMPGQ